MWYKISTHWDLVRNTSCQVPLRPIKPESQGVQPSNLRFNKPSIWFFKAAKVWEQLTSTLISLHSDYCFCSLAIKMNNEKYTYNESNHLLQPIPGHLHLSPCLWTTVMACKQVSPPKPTVHFHTAATVILPKEKSDHIFLEWVPMTLNINSYKDISFGCY